MNWILIYDPPKSQKDQDFKTQQYYSYRYDTILYSDVYSNDSGYTAVCSAAEIPRQENIRPGLYQSWYSLRAWEYGGRINHPDPWVSQENCQPNYEFSFSGRPPIKIPEIRYAYIPDQNLSAADTLWSLSHTPPNLTIGIPCGLNTQNRTLIISKSAACDNSSLPFAHQISWNSGTEPGTENLDDYCPRSLQNTQLDGEHQRLLQLELQIASLETERDVALAYGDITAAGTQNGDFRTQAWGDFAIASGSPSSGGTPDPDATESPIPADVNPDAPISKEILIEQAEWLSDTSRALSQRINQVMADMSQSDMPKLSDEKKALYEQIIAQFPPINRSLSQLKGNLDILCKPQERPDTAASLDLIFAGFNDDRSLSLHGRVNHGGIGSVEEIEIQHDQYLQLVGPPDLIEKRAGLFELRIPFENYRFTENFYNSPIHEGNALLTDQIPELYAKLRWSSFRTQAGQIQQSQRIADDKYGYAYSHCRNKEICFAEPHLPALVVISPEEMVEYLKLTSTDATLGVLGTGAAGIIVAGTASTVIEIAIPTSIIDFTPTGKVAGKLSKVARYVYVNGRRYWSRSAPVVVDGVEFLTVRVAKKDLPHISSTIIQKKNAFTGRASVTQSMDSLLSMVARFPDLQSVTSTIPGGAKKWTNLQASITNYGKTQEIKTLERHLGLAYGNFHELLVGYQLKKASQRTGGELKNIAYEYPVSINGHQYEIDIYYEIAHQKVYGEIKYNLTQKSSRIGEKYINDDIPLDFSKELGTKFGVQQFYRGVLAAKQNNARFVIHTASISDQAIVKISRMFYEHGVPFSPHRNIYIIGE